MLIFRDCDSDCAGASSTATAEAAAAVILNSGINFVCMPHALLLYPPLLRLVVVAVVFVYLLPIHFVVGWR